MTISTEVGHRDPITRKITDIGLNHPYRGSSCIGEQSRRRQKCKRDIDVDGTENNLQRCRDSLNTENLMIDWSRSIFLLYGRYSNTQ